MICDIWFFIHDTWCMIFEIWWYLIYDNMIDYDWLQTWRLKVPVQPPIWGTMRWAERMVPIIQSQRENVAFNTLGSLIDPSYLHTSREAMKNLRRSYLRSISVGWRVKLWELWGLCVFFLDERRDKNWWSIADWDFSLGTCSEHMDFFHDGE